MITVGHVVYLLKNKNNFDNTEDSTMSHIFRFIGSRDGQGRWTVPEEELKHIRIVGLGKDDKLEFIDGMGKYSKVRIQSVSSKSIDFDEIPGSFKIIPFSPFKLGLVTGILKNTQELLAPLTEIGVDAIYLFSQPHSKKDLTDRLKQKFLSTLRSSTKQSKRYFIPKLYFFSSFKECIQHINQDPLTQRSRKLLLDETSSSSLLDIKVNQDDSFLLFSGSELGFTQEEIEILNSENMEKYNIGSFILRSITASTCSSMIMNLKIKKIKNNQ